MGIGVGKDWRRGRGALAEMGKEEGDRKGTHQR